MDSSLLIMAAVTTYSYTFQSKFNTHLIWCYTHQYMRNNKNFFLMLTLSFSSSLSIVLKVNTCPCQAMRWDTGCASFHQKMKSIKPFIVKSSISVQRSTNDGMKDAPMKAISSIDLKMKQREEKKTRQTQIHRNATTIQQKKLNKFLFKNSDHVMNARFSSNIIASRMRSSYKKW